MPVTFVQQKKRQKYLISIFLIVLVITFFVLWLGFFRKEKAPSPEISLPAPREVKIKFELLESSALENLQPFERISPLEEEAGRENPFLPY